MKGGKEGERRRREDGEEKHLDIGFNFDYVLRFSDIVSLMEIKCMP